MSIKSIKKLCAIALLTVMSPMLALATSYVWVGGSKGDINSPANWNPVRESSFTSSDELIINSPANISLLTDTTVGKIVVSASSGVVFSSASDEAKLNVG